MSWTITSYFRRHLTISQWMYQSRRKLIVALLIVWGLIILSYFRSAISQSTLTHEPHGPTGVHHLFFNLVSSNRTWETKKPFVRTWWDHHIVRGRVWVDIYPNHVLKEPFDPPIQVSSDVPFMDSGKSTRLVKIARIIIDAYRLNIPNVRWFIVGHDDTYFSPLGIAAILSKYDHTSRMYIGASSESHVENIRKGHWTGFGGAGYAVSIALARTLNDTLDHCLASRNELLPPDRQVADCIAELGVSLTRERGFHQCDIRGSMAGLLEGHVPEVFASLHDVASFDSLFPGSKGMVHDLTHLTTAVKGDPVGFLQRSLCHDLELGNWTLSIAWGYSAKFYPRNRQLSELEAVERTFTVWPNGLKPEKFAIDVRLPEAKVNQEDLCSLPFVLYFTETKFLSFGAIHSYYERPTEERLPNETHCRMPAWMNRIRVVRSQQMEVPRASNGLGLGPTLSRQCCTQYMYDEANEDLVPTFILEECGENHQIAPTWGHTIGGI